MELQKVIDIVSQKVGSMPVLYKEMVTAGRLKEVLELLNLDSVPRPDGFSKKESKKIIANTIYNKFRQMGMTVKVDSILNFLQG